MSDQPTYNVTNYGANGQAIGQQNIHIGSQPRTFGTADSENLRATARTFKGTAIDLTCLLGDSEGFSFALRIKEILDEAGWQISGVDQTVFTGPVEGVVLRCRDSEAPAWLTAIGNALLRAGIQARGETESDRDGIIVGHS